MLIYPFLLQASSKGNRSNLQSLGFRCPRTVTNAAQHICKPQPCYNIKGCHPRCVGEEGMNLSICLSPICPTSRLAFTKGFPKVFHSPEMVYLPVPTALSLPKKSSSHAQKRFLCSFSEGMSPMVTWLGGVQAPHSCATPPQACPTRPGCRERVPRGITGPQEDPTASGQRLT